jgi:hypothetical protein
LERKSFKEKLVGCLVDEWHGFGLLSAKLEERMVLAVKERMVLAVAW